MRESRFPEGESVSLSRDETRAGVVSHILRHELLRRQELREKVRSLLSGNNAERRPPKMSSGNWDVFWALAKSYLTLENPVISDVHLMTGGSRSTVQRSLRKLDKLGVISIEVDLLDQRRRLVNLARPYKTLLDGFVDECFEEFKELIELRDRGERQRAEAALKESEEKFRTLFEHASDAIFIIDPQTLLFLDANDTALGYLGYTLDELRRLSVSDINRPDAAEVIAQRRRIRERDGSMVFDTIHICKDGSEVPMEMNVHAVEFGGQRVLQAFARDITKRKKAEKERAESEEKYRRLFEHANDAIFVSDPRTRRFLDVNENAAKRLGYSRDELLRMNAADISHPGRSPFQKDIYAALQKTGEALFESIHRRKDGSTIPVEVSARLIEYGGRRVIQSFARDITERKLAEEAMRESEARLLAILENNPFGVVVASLTERKRFFVNRRYVEMSGGESPESFLTGDFIDTFVDPEVFRKHWAEYRRTGYLAQAETQRRRLDGSLWRCLYDWRPFTFKGEEAVIIWHHDITDHVHADQLLRESEQRFHDFADSAADRFWETDEDYRITYLSPAPPGSGLPEESEIVGAIRWEISGMDPETWRGHRADIAARRPFRDFRFRRTRKDGRVAHVRLNGKPVFDAEEKFKGYRGTHIDETDLVEARQEAEKARAESEERYRDLYDNAPVPYFSVDPADGRYTAANQAALHLFATDLETLTRKTVADFRPRDPENKEERADLFQRMKSGETFRDLELEIRAADGTPKWVSLSLDPIRDGQGKVVELRASAADITERKRAEAGVREAHAKLRDAFESISGRVSLYDSEDRFVMCNSRFLEELPELEDVMVPGASFETILRASVERDLHPDLEGDVDEWIARRVARHRARETFERQWKGRQWVQVNKYRTHDGGTLIIGTDITERKKVEEELRRTQEKLMEAISSIAVGVDVYDAEDRLSMTRAGWRRIGSQTTDLFVIGETFEEILRRTVEKGLIPEAREDPERWIEWRQARHREKKGATEIMLDDGSWVQLLEYGTEDGGTLVICSDVTKRKKAEEKAQASAMEKGVPLDQIDHRVKNNF